MFGPGKLVALVDAESNVRIWRTSPDLASLDTTCRMDRDLQDTDSGVNGCSGKELFKVQGKD